MKKSMKKLGLVLMATMMLLFSFSATTSASGRSTSEVYLGYLSLNSAIMAVSGNVTVPSSYAVPGWSGYTSDINVVVWKQDPNGNWYSVQGKHVAVLANGQSQPFGVSDARYDQRQMNLQSGVYKVTVDGPPGTTFSNLNAWTYNY
ncbi:hypothetical protein ACFQZE_04225 [Paenibacillus sp. GCM10027627]|uniref:hypothetical protein n=1 Tax=unclassified Paenibacillus TaxID=185978 RepID=UPI00363C7B5D